MNKPTKVSLGEEGYAYCCSPNWRKDGPRPVRKVKVIKLGRRWVTLEVGEHARESQGHPYIGNPNAYLDTDTGRIFASPKESGFVADWIWFPTMQALEDQEERPTRLQKLSKLLTESDGTKVRCIFDLLSQAGFIP